MSDDIGQKLDRILETQTSILVVQAEHKEILKQHMRRTSLAEQSLVELRQFISLVKRGLEAQLEPVRRDMDRVKFLGACIVGLGILLGVAASILELSTKLAN